MTPCSIDVLREQVVCIHGGHPERFTLPCSFRSSANGVHALLRRAGETIAVGSSSSDSSGARLITARTDRPRLTCSEFRDLLSNLGGSGEVVVEESLADTARTACRELDGTELQIRYNLSLYRYAGSPASVDHGDPGIRDATESDVPLIAEWTRAFDSETGYSRSGCKRDFEQIARENISSCRVVILEVEGVPVAMGQRQRVSWSGQNRIGLLFVPPEQRSTGHARRVVRGLVASIQEEGAVPCLFTQRENPISNRLYKGMSFARTEYLVHLASKSGD
ncbi:MAG: GNAT family N-acetyltransferase [Planctomycetota bacterium]|nr:GNAT family N-acetyltransferase [Planctomycetota bacterium]